MTVTADYRPVLGEDRSGPWTDPRCGGHTVTATDDFDAAMTEAGITWDVKVEQAHRPNGDAIPDSFHHYRSDNGYKLGVFDGSYTPIRHRQLAQVADELVKVARPHGGLKVSSAGELAGGKSVFFAFELGDPYRIGSDSHEIAKYVTMFTSHDRSNALTLIQNDIRYGCANAAPAAAFDVRSGAASGFRIRHTRNSADRLEEAVDGLKQVLAWQVKTRESLEKLSRESFDDNQYEMLVRQFVPINKKWSERKKTIRSSIRDTLREIGSEANANQEGIVGTAYGALQAVVEWEDHFYGYSSNEQRIVRTLRNGNVAGKRNAFKLITKLIGRKVTRSDLALVA